jgi:NADH-quinone oxidoreductase subunit H
MHDFNFWATLITIIVIMGIIQGTCAYLILLERKISAWMQDRIGPNRVGPRGLLQPIADGLKFLFKEDIIPGHVDKLLYLLAPAVALATATLAFAVVPFGPTSVPPSPPPAEATTEQKERYDHDLDVYRHSYQFVIAPNVNIGILFTFAITSLAVYGIILGGWSANSKYSFLGAMRSSAQLISYEIPLGLSILGVVLMTGSLSLERIIQQQVTPAGGGWGIWNICYQPLAFLLFLTGAFAECNRLPFDLPEAEQELVGGYHTEYSALKFGMFFLGEYTHMITTSFLLVILFFGGWHVPLLQSWINQLSQSDNVFLFVPGKAILVLCFGIKMAAFIVFYMLIRWTLPRFRFDQLMGLAWKVLIPLALLNLVCVMVIKEMAWSPWWLLPASLVLFVGAAVVAAQTPTPRPRVVLTRDGERLETVAR